MPKKLLKNNEVSANRKVLTTAFEKIYKQKEFLFPYEHGLSNFPFYIDIEITNACNLDCIMCNRQLMSRKVGFMDFPIFTKIVDQMAEFSSLVGLRFVRHGEPTLHKNLPGMVAYANRKSVLTFVSTNGLLLNVSLIKALLTNSLDEVRFSMQGTNCEEYRKLRKIDAYDVFKEKVILFRNVRDDLSSHVFISLCTSITDESEEQIQSFKDFWSEIVDRVIIDKTIFTRVEHIERVKDYIQRQTFEKRYKPCTEVMTKLSINYNGDITPCCKDYDGQLVLGNVRDITLKQAWNSPELNKLREMVGEKLLHSRIPFCEGCYLVSTKFDTLKMKYREEGVK